MADSIAGALGRWKDGDAAALLVVQDKLRPLLLEMLALVRRRRARDLRARIDSEGVVNEALNSFLTGIPKGEFPTLECRQDVQRVLTTLVLRTLTDDIRRETAGKRDAARESPSPQGRPEHLADPRPAAGDEPGRLAPDLAEWLDDLEIAVRPVHKNAMDIVELSLEGLDNLGIADEIGLGVRRVQVLKQAMYERLLQRRRQEEA